MSDAYVDWSRLNGVSQLIGSLCYYTIQMRRWYCEENWKQSKQEVGARTGAISLSNCFRPPAATLPLRKSIQPNQDWGSTASRWFRTHTRCRGACMHFACLSPFKRQRKSAMQCLAAEAEAPQKQQERGWPVACLSPCAQKAVKFS